MTITAEQQQVIDAVCERLRKGAERKLDHGVVFGVELGRLSKSDAVHVGNAVLAALKTFVPGPWPEQEPQVKCWLDGNVLRTRFTLEPGPAADQLARAGVDVRCADGTPYMPMDHEIVITVKETI